ncbi:MAG: alpha/beta fold hydrolase [Actinomycetota bacterium]
MLTDHRVVLVASDGVQLSARHWPHEGSEVGYVVAHGFTGSSRSRQVDRICRRLAGHGATVLAPDFRGHGQSGGRSSIGDVEIRDVAAAASFLRARDVSRLALLGWSMGGSVVLRYAGLGGDADAVVSVSSPGLWYERGTAPLRLVHWVAETRTGRLIVRIVKRVRLTEGWPELPESPVEVVGRIAPTPLLIVHGDADHFFPVRHAELLAAAAPDADYWLEVGMTHAETGTDARLVDRIDGWVRVATGAPAAAERLGLSAP